jgi:leader peptidase (prepilin peptidase)/N-methyltransferase
LRIGGVLDFVTALWLGFTGACIGSFLNVVAYRAPRGMSVVWKPSHCPQCGHAIRVRDNIPVLGWLLLGGRCRDCRAAISPRYAIVEAAMGLAFFVLAYVELFSGAANLPAAPRVDEPGALATVWNPNWSVIGIYAFHCALLSLLMALVLIDQDGFRVPWRAVAVALVIIGYASYRWWFLYPERTRTTRVVELKAPLDALAGCAWGALPWLAAAAAAYSRGKNALVRPLTNIAAAAGIVGAGFGLRAVVRMMIAWLPCAWLAHKLHYRGARVGLLTPLWLLTFLHLAFWKPLAALINW